MSGTSEIAQELAKLYVSKRSILLVHGRNQKKLDMVVRKLQEVDKDAEVIALPTIDLIHPKLEEMKHQNFESVYDGFYRQWFDDLVMKHGLPTQMIIAGGGSSDTASGTIELNAVSAIKCCENYIRKVREHAHNEKYKNKQFSIVYMNSFLGERPDLWENAVVYAQAKRCVKEYLNLIREEVKDVRLKVQNAIIGPIDTNLLRRFYKKVPLEQMGPFEKLYQSASMFILPMFTTSVEKAATDLKQGIESGADEFYVPNFFAYMPYVLDFLPNLWKLISNGILFCILFVPQYRNMVLGFLKRIPQFFGF